MPIASEPAPSGTGPATLVGPRRRYAVLAERRRHVRVREVDAKQTERERGTPGKEQRDADHAHSWCQSDISHGVIPPWRSRLARTEILRVHERPEPLVEHQIPANVIGIVEEHDLIARPRPVLAIGGIEIGDAEREAVEPE